MKFISLTKRIGVLAIMLSLYTFTSCEKYLEIPAPTNSITTSTVYNTKETIDLLLNNMYNNWATTNCIAAVYSRSSELYSDNAYNPTGTSNYPVSTGTLSVADNAFAGLWTNCYKSIYQANLLLEGLSTATILDEATRNAYIAAALTIRASGHYYLVRSYGDCPLVLSTDVASNKAVSRTPATEVWAQVIKDLKEAMTLLPETGTTNKRYFTNKYQPEAMLARVYTTMGNWPEAEVAANEVISSGKYQLVSKPADVFNRTSTEVISAMGNTSSASVKVQNTAYIGILYLPYNASGETTYPALSEDLLNSFETGDSRKSSWIVLKNKSNYSNPNNRYFCCKYINQNDPAYTTGIPAGKEQDFVFIRLAEIYLIRAEARAHQNKLGGAADDLNLIRNRAGLANKTITSQTDLLNAIIHERRIELCYEGGFRWDDLVRIGTADAVISALPWKINWHSYQTVFPIDEGEMRLNSILTQNPGY